LGRADGGRVVVTVCDEPLARGGGAVERGWPGLVWCKSVVPAGISTWSGLLWVGWLAGRGGCHGVVTSGAKHGGTEADALRRFLQISGRGGTGWDG